MSDRLPECCLNVAHKVQFLVLDCICTQNACRVILGIKATNNVSCLNICYDRDEDIFDNFQHTVNGGWLLTCFPLVATPPNYCTYKLLQAYRSHNFQLKSQATITILTLNIQYHTSIHNKSVGGTLTNLPCPKKQTLLFTHYKKLLTEL